MCLLVPGCVLLLIKFVCLYFVSKFLGPSCTLDRYIVPSYEPWIEAWLAGYNLIALLLLSGRSFASTWEEPRVAFVLLFLL